jgi:uncharacterized protein (TIGR00369 family)
MERSVNDKSPNTGVVQRDVLLAHDGLSFLKAIIAGTIPQPPITETLGFRLVDAENGRAVFEGEPQHRHANPMGTTHAGFAATLLDSAMACTVHSTLAKGESYTTLELKVNLVRALTAEVGAVRAEGRLVHRGRSVATADAELRDGAGKLYAHATTTCMIFPATG